MIQRGRDYDPHAHKCVYVRVQVIRIGRTDDSHTNVCMCVCAYVRTCVRAYVRVQVIRRERDDDSH